MPNLVLIDTFSSTDYIYVKKVFPHAHVLYLHPMLSTIRHTRYPNFNKEMDSAYIWESNSTKNNLIRLVGLAGKLVHVLAKNYMNRLLHRGQNSSSMMKAEYRKSELDIDTRYLANHLVKGVTELILAPQELEYSNEYRQSNQIYLGLCVLESRTDHIDREFDIDILARCKSQYKKIIYVAFGTYGSKIEQLSAIMKFIKKVDAVASINPEYLFVIAAKVDKKYLGTNQNVLLYNRVPQMAVLRLSDLFITHGGLGSVKEAIETMCPMIVCTLDKVWDQTGNGAKVKHHGLGEYIGHISNISTDSLSKSISKIFQDGRYLANINAFHYTINQRYSEEYWNSCLGKVIPSTLFNSSSNLKG
jgi:UDP:flavonoid glycosyltransferase YjiC (YdhE family)